MGGHRPSEDEKTGLANYLSKRPHLNDWDRPTAWLLGAQVISSLRQLILSAIHTGFDQRDWMTAEEGGVVLHDQSDDRLPLEQDRNAGNVDEYWFDFVADTGDAPALVYCLSRALQQPRLEAQVDEATPAHTTTLPRGRLLVLGGDSAYPVADETAIRERWQAPHIWAHQANQQLDSTTPTDPVPVFAIPGNHDYYDALDGFGRQFRKQATPDNERCQKYPDWFPPLRLPAYRREQLASYFALQLPFHWHLWGVDLGAHPDEEQPIDTRQQEYFYKLQNPTKPDEGKPPNPPPDKLIVVTALPVAVHHASAEKLVSPFEQLRLDPAFGAKGTLSSGARLDLSGDVHLYERYWGVTVPAAPDAPAEELLGQAHGGEPRSNYVAVASGLGGAFHHPSQVRYCHEEKDRITPQRSWPREADSRERIADVLTRPRKVFQAGSVGVLGALLGVFFYLWSTTRLGDGAGVLKVPPLLLEGSFALATDAFLDFGRVFLFIVAAGAGIYGVTLIKKRTTKIHEAMLEPTAPRSIRGALEWLLGADDTSSYRARALRWTGANRRVITSTFLRFPWWLVFFADVALVVFLGWLLLHHARDVGTNFPAAILVAGLTAFPFITNTRWKYRWPIFIPLGLVHGFAQLLTPQLWANATATFIVAIVLLGGYWCVRPLIAYLYAHHGRWLTPIWLGLVAVMTLGPMVLPRLVLPSWNGVYTIILALWLGLGLAGVASARRWVRQDRMKNWHWWGLGATLGLQVVALIAVPYVHLFVGAENEWRLGLVAAAVSGGLLACLWLGWYLAVCLQWGWHGNDAGSVSRVDDFAEFMRIKLTASTAEVWVIAVDANVKKRHPADPDTFEGAARLVDHFKVTAKGP